MVGSLESCIRHIPVHEAVKADPGLTGDTVYLTVGLGMSGDPLGGARDGDIWTGFSACCY